MLSAIQLRENSRRLREEIELLRETIVDRDLEIKDHIREIERLRVEIVQLETLTTIAAAQQAEIERLRNESHADEQRYQAAKAEIERLQAIIKAAYNALPPFYNADTEEVRKILRDEQSE